jgi:hypothetical protein
MSKNKVKIAIKYLKFCILSCNFAFCILSFTFICLAEEEFKYDSKGRRNPFIPLVTSEGRILKLDREQRQDNDLLIEGIIYDKNGLSYAIINGVVASVGDAIGDYQVLKIEDRKVILIKEGVITEIELKEEQ